MREGNASSDIRVDIRKQFIAAEEAGISAMWKTYIILTDCHEKSWEYLSTISSIAEERATEVADGEIVSAYLAMIDMIDSLAARSLDKQDDYHSFCKSRADWEDRFWRIISW